MKVVIFGANGKTGQLLIEQALAKGYQVVAYVRTYGSILMENPNLKVVVGNLNETLKLKDALSGADACISALGGRSLTKHSTELRIGIVNIVSIMEDSKVPRFIYLSSLGVRESSYLIPQPMRFFLTKVFLRVPLIDHTVNEEYIMKSKLKWTIVRPGRITEGDLTGNWKHGSEKTKLEGNAGISRSNVASFLIKQLTDTTYYNKAVWLYESNKQ